jgi:hypothetical protein
VALAIALDRLSQAVARRLVAAAGARIAGLARHPYCPRRWRSSSSRAAGLA